MRTAYTSHSLIMVLLISALFSCNSSPSEEPTRIDWDSWGVPHITASTDTALFFAQGWAQMHNHANHILRLYGKSRGQGAEYWGEELLGNDMIIHTLRIPEMAARWTKEQDPELQGIYKSFADGINAYAEAHPDVIEEDNRIVLPVTPDDINMHSMFVIFTRFVGGSELGRAQRWPDMGSNTYAIGPDRSASGNAMLVQNPHLPWSDEFLFFESHFNYKGRNLYGVTLTGFPGIAIGFNESLGWSHTDNTIDNSDTYEVEIRDGQYLLDGEPREFDVQTKTIKVKNADGEMRNQEIQLYATEHGPVIKRTEDAALALRIVGTDRQNMFLQWWRMINSSNLEEFESVLQMAQIPFWNVMYADKYGEIFYLFNGLVPKRADGDWNYWNRIIPDGNTTDIWTDVHPYSDLPKVKNPENGWLQNANDPPWYSTIPMALDPDDFPPYMAPRGMYFRPQRSARMLMEDESISYEELMEYKLSTRLETADRLLDDLFEAVENSSSEKAKEAVEVLKDWDRKADKESVGTVLFQKWVQKWNIWNQANYEVPWSPDNPVSTPDGISDPQRAVQLLEASADEMLEQFGKLDVAWGDFYRLKYRDFDLPANGADGSLGVFRVAWPAGGDETHLYVGGGDSWVGVIEFGEQPRAKVLLSYGNATQDGSPHVGDQLELFSEKSMRDAWITREEIEANTVRTELRTDSGFSEKEIK